MVTGARMSDCFLFFLILVTIIFEYTRKRERDATTIANNNGEREFFTSYEISGKSSFVLFRLVVIARLLHS